MPTMKLMCEAMQVKIEAPLLGTQRDAFAAGCVNSWAEDGTQPGIPNRLHLFA